MSPWQILDAMALLAGHEVRITHGEKRDEWGFEPRVMSRVARLLSLFGSPPLVEFGKSSARINVPHPVTISFTDLRRRRKNEHNKALGRLRRFMRKRGWEQTELEQSDHTVVVSFEKQSGANKKTPPPVEPPAQIPDCKMRNSGRPIQEQDVVELEEYFEIRLPAEYRTFLLASNGGEPIHEELRFRHRGRENSVVIERFLSIEHAPGTDQFDATDVGKDLAATIEFQQGNLNLPESLIPIAALADDVICLVVAGEQRGHLFLWYLIEGGFAPERLVPLADSFSQLLERLSRLAGEP